jgi:hypothetical protein
MSRAFYTCHRSTILKRAAAKKSNLRVLKTTLFLAERFFKIRKAFGSEREISRALAVILVDKYF